MYDDPADEVKLPPLQDALMEVLAARARLGETLWTFSRTQAPALEKLAQRGLVTTMHGIVEHTVRARLTDTGHALYVKGSYLSPLEKETRHLREHCKTVKAQRDEARDLLVDQC